MVPWPGDWTAVPQERPQTRLAIAQLLKPYTNLFYKSCECVMSVQLSVCMSSRVRYEQHGLLNLCNSSGVIRRLRTVAARVRDQVNSWVICVRQSGPGAGYLRVLKFPLPILIPQSAPQSCTMVWGWWNRPVSQSVSQWHSTKWILSINTLVWSFSSALRYHHVSVSGSHV
jgi:hypothetical protein